MRYFLPRFNHFLLLARTPIPNITNFDAAVLLRHQRSQGASTFPKLAVSPTPSPQIPHPQAPKFLSPKPQTLHPQPRRRRSLLSKMLKERTIFTQWQNGDVHRMRRMAMFAQVKSERTKSGLDSDPHHVNLITVEKIDVEPPGARANEKP